MQHREAYCRRLTVVMFLCLVHASLEPQEYREMLLVKRNTAVNPDSASPKGW